PSPEDRIRLAILEALLQQSRPGSAQGVDVQALTEAAPHMNVDELKAALKSVQTTVSLGNTAVSAIQAQIKAKMGKRGLAQSGCYWSAFRTRTIWASATLPAV